ncbi:MULTISPECIES: hypothetical protein [Methylobacterium]|uniref:hypothetical protein n=1 Tax=Methylobacterium TaxID=407 RepID=UPI00164FCF17|nr:MULTISPECIES: hypothetical protein [Methylobacterium]
MSVQRVVLFAPHFAEYAIALSERCTVLQELRRHRDRGVGGLSKRAGSADAAV